jgi:hypothetical protein
MTSMSSGWLGSASPGTEQRTLLQLANLLPLAAKTRGSRDAASLPGPRDTRSNCPPRDQALIPREMLDGPPLRWIQGCLLALLVFSVSGAWGQDLPAPTLGDLPLRLTWASPDPACNGSGVTAEALRLVAPGVVPRPLVAHAKLERDSTSWVVQLQTRSADHSGQRVLRAETCQEIEHAMALLLAMILETEAQPLPEPAEAPAPPPAVAAVVPPARAANAERPAPTPALDVPDEFGWLLRLDGSLGVGLKPRLSGGLGGGIGLSWGRLDLMAGGTYWPATRRNILDREGYIEVARQNWWLSGCFQVARLGRLDIAPCVEPELTLFEFRSVDILEVNEGRPNPLLSLTTSAELRYWLADRWLFVSIAPGVTWEKRQPFELSFNCTAPCQPERIQVYETLGVGPRLRMGVGARF